MRSTYQRVREVRSRGGRRDEIQISFGAAARLLGVGEMI